MDDIVTIHSFSCDLNSGPCVVNLRQPLMHQDALADTFRVAVCRDMKPVDLTGMIVQGYLYFPATRQTLPLDGMISEHYASVTLTNGCYAMPGWCSLVIQLKQGDVRHTVLKVDFAIQRTGSEHLIAPGCSTTLPELIARIEALEKGSGGSSSVAVDATLTKAGKAADAKATGDRLASLVEEMAGQTAPESYDAKGDGVTDDAAAITQALASGKNVVFDGTKTYAVGSVITIPADSFVDFRGATVVPMGNHDVIKVMPGSYTENLVVNCAAVPGWDASAVVIYGGDGHRASNPTRLNNIKLFNDKTFNNGYSVGNGIYLYLDANGRYIDGVSISNASTCGFGYGIRMSDLTDSEEYKGNKGFIGASNFSNYWSFKDKIGISIDAKSTHCLITNNFFTDLNIQSDYYNSSQYAIYCRGDSNYFSGCLYDYSILDYHPVTAVYFDVGSVKNYVEVTAGKVFKAGYCIDLGAYNKVEKSCYKGDVITPVNMEVGAAGNQDDVLAFLDKRATCTLESLDVEPAVGDISCVFDPSPSKELTYYKDPATGRCRAVITMNLNRVLRKMTCLILQTPLRRAPKSIKVTVFNSQAATVIYDTKNNAENNIIISPAFDEFDYIYDIAKIVVELDGTYSFGDVEFPNWTLSRIMAVDGYATGNAWMRRDGGVAYGNVRFAENTGPVLIAEDGKWYKLIVGVGGALSTVEIPVEEEETPEVAVLVPTMAAGATWYNADLAGAAQNTITSVTFDATYEPTGSEDANWPCDDSNTGYIMAYRNGTNIVIKSTTGSNGVKLNANSAYMFAANGNQANFTALSSITGTDTWNAGKNTDCTGILTGNTVITNPITIPDGVYILQNAFNGCTALTAPPVLPEGVVAMNNCFANCHAMQYLPELPSTIQNMEYAFHVCKAATRGPSVIPASAKKITAAFRNCWYLNGNIEVNAEALTSYSACFENTSRDGGAVVLTGSCPLLAELAATNTQGKVTVAS